MNDKLIKDARELVHARLAPMEQVARSWADASSTQEADKLGASAAHLREATLMIGRLADALDHATRCTCPSGDGSLRWPCPKHPPTPPRVPVQGGPNDDREAVTGNELADAVHAYYEASGKPANSEGVRAVLLASRATVPDAATEGRLTQAELEDIAETHAFCADRLYIEVENVLELRDECDAALAAAERVRVLAYQHRSLEQHNEMVPMSDIADLIREPSSAEYLAALDGAPEPEWEWGVRSPATGNCYPLESEGAARELHADSVNRDLVRRRTAGPWLPVEGESKP